MLTSSTFLGKLHSRSKIDSFGFHFLSLSGNKKYTNKLQHDPKAEVNGNFKIFVDLSGPKIG